MDLAKWPSRSFRDQNSFAIYSNIIELELKNIVIDNAGIAGKMFSGAKIGLITDKNCALSLVSTGFLPSPLRLW